MDKWHSPEACIFEWKLKHFWPLYVFLIIQLIQPMAGMQYQSLNYT